VNLADELGLDPNDNRGVVKTLERGLEDATRYQRQLGGIHDPGLSLTEMRKKMQQLRTALDRLAEARGNPETWLRNLEKRLFKIPPKWRQYLDTLDRAFPLPSGPRASAFEAEARSLHHRPADEVPDAARRLRSIVDVFLSDMRTPGRGNARMQGRRYIKGIEKLAEWFHEALPEYPLSAKPHTRFHAYVRYWLNTCLQDDLEDPERHIRAALAEGTDGHR